MYNERSGPGSCGNRVQLVQGLSSVHNSSNTHRPLSLGVPTTPIPRFIHDSLCRTYRSSSEHLVLRRSNLKSASDAPKASNFHVALVTRRINNSKPTTRELYATSMSMLDAIPCGKPRTVNGSHNFSAPTKYWRGLRRSIPRTTVRDAQRQIHIPMYLHLHPLRQCQ